MESGYPNNRISINSGYPLTTLSVLV